jgi:hypothetical protein
VAEGYHMAVDYDMSAFGGGMIVPQFGGKLLRTEMEQVEGGHALHIHFGVSEEIKNLATVFGNPDDIESFNKAAGAFKKAGDDLFKLSKVELDSGKPQPDLRAEAKAIEDSPNPQASKTFSRGAIRLTMKKIQQ